MTTLRIDAKLLQQAEQQARRHNIDLNQMVESFIRKFIKQPVTGDASEIKITSFVERLGVDLDLPADFDEREAYRKHLEKKYQ